MPNTDIATYDKARAAGLSPASAARWVAYLNKCAGSGVLPITLTEAVQQRQAAKGGAA